MEFAHAFNALTENAPFPWQRQWYKHLVAGEFDEIATTTIPTGLGKTSVLASWLIAFANNPAKVPRRLVYVVNRRTVVDQTTTEAENLRANAAAAGLPVPAISTLRGQFADNREWSSDPSQPAIIAGTVDMIGSRLLFSGYGCGFKSKPLQAGFLGQDVLLVHDEAHLEPAFQKLLVAIQEEQKRCGEFQKFHVVELSATSRGDGKVFKLTPDDYKDREIKKRIGARKSITLHELDDEKKLPDRIAELALEHGESKQPILVFARTVEAVEKISEKLRKAKQKVENLTGTLRGKERDDLVKKPLFQRFLKPDPDTKTVYLVCTSAGEVGVNISADHLVCDLSTFESMAQRFGRVNRFGTRSDTRIDVAFVSGLPSEVELDAERAKEPAKQNPAVFMDGARRRTLDLLRMLSGNGSPEALGNLDPDARLAAFSPSPKTLLTSDILFDSWALTTIRDHLPGRPPVTAYLHGIEEGKLSDTLVAWRDEVGLLTGLFPSKQLQRFLEDYPLKPHELLKDRTYRVMSQLEQIAERDAAQELDKRLSAWVVDAEGRLAVYRLEKLVEKDKQKRPVVRLAGCTVVLPPPAGGLEAGLLKGGSVLADDVSEEWLDEKNKARRCRVWDEEDGNDDKTKGMRLIREIDTKPEADEEDEEPAGRRFWKWFVRPAFADDDASRVSRLPVTWKHHTNDVIDNVKRIAQALRLPDDLSTALELAAQFHDLGKRRTIWQRSIGNNGYPGVELAKSGGRMKLRELNAYRHEFGSLLDIYRKQKLEPQFQKQQDEIKDLVLHLIAVHHGYGRPHFPKDRAFDPEANEADALAVACEVPGRFVRLQRKFGRWGLAYLESILRAADISASIYPTKEVT